MSHSVELLRSFANEECVAKHKKAQKWRSRATGTPLTSVSQPLSRGGGSFGCHSLQMWQKIILLIGVRWCQLGATSSLQSPSWRYPWLGLCLSPSVAHPMSHLPVLFDCCWCGLCKRRCWQTWCHQVMTCALYAVNTVFLGWAGFLSADTFIWTEYSNLI